MYNNNPCLVLSINVKKFGPVSCKLKITTVEKKLNADKFNLLKKWMNDDNSTWNERGRMYLEENFTQNFILASVWPNDVLIIWCGLKILWKKKLYFQVFILNLILKTGFSQNFHQNWKLENRNRWKIQWSRKHFEFFDFLPLLRILLFRLWVSYLFINIPFLSFRYKLTPKKAFRFGNFDQMKWLQ